MMATESRHVVHRRASQSRKHIEDPIHALAIRYPKFLFEYIVQRIAAGVAVHRGRRVAEMRK